MGCDWVAVRNLAITLGVFVGLGTSSAMFATTFWRFAPHGPWKRWVTGASFGSAAAWLATALIFLAILMSVVGSFCGCTEAIPACRSACESMGYSLRTLLGVLVALLALCTVAAAEPSLMDNLVFGSLVITATLGTGAAMGFVAFYAAQVTGCQ